jgi:metal-responsive CopG/Arc/MetJ family transcriptional regulator
MSERKYSSVSVHAELLKRIDDVLESGKTTYTSRADFIQDAIRIRLRELGKIK